jgi:chromosome segregation ATPase
MELETVITPAIISLTVSGAIEIVRNQLNQKNKLKSSSFNRDTEVADRFYDELRLDIDSLKKQLGDAEHRATKWQEQYYQLFAKYQIVKAHYEQASHKIENLTKAIEELKISIHSKEQTS